VVRGVHFPSGQGTERDCTSPMQESVTSIRMPLEILHFDAFRMPTIFRLSSGVARH